MVFQIKPGVVKGNTALLGGIEPGFEKENMALKFFNIEPGFVKENMALYPFLENKISLEPVFH